MKKLLELREREKLQSTFKTHPLFLTSEKVFFHRQTHLKSLVIEPEDVFRESARLLDFLLLHEEKLTQRAVNNLWTQLVSDIRSWKPDARDEDKMLVAGTVFCIVRDILGHHWNYKFREDIYDMLTETLDSNQTIVNEKEQQQFLACLTECSQQLSDWINGYQDWIDSDIGDWLSDEIAAVLEKKSVEDDKKQTVLEQLKPIFWNNEEEAIEFYQKCINAKPTQITKAVQQLVKEKKISDVSYRHDLWEILHDAGIYPRGVKNWCHLVKV